MNKFLGTCIALVMAGMIGSASADLILSKDSVEYYAANGYGIYLGTFGKIAGEGSPMNDDDLDAIIKQIISSDYYKGDSNIVLDRFKKVESNSTGDLFMTVTYDSTNKSGTWATSEEIEFYTVKAGPEYSIWWLENGKNSGNWTTHGLLAGNKKNIKQPGISHLTAFNDKNNTNVPEPGVISMLGIGLISLVGLSRRRLK